MKMNGKPCFIIAEVGVNHNCDVDIAKKLIDAAADAGADAVKFQTAIPELVVTPFAPMTKYQQRNMNPSSEALSEKAQLDLIRDISLPLSEFKPIKRWCEDRGVVFFSTAFDLKSAKFLNELGQEIHKVPSGEITNLPYLKLLSSFKKPIILSTGMSNLDEIRDALEILLSNGMQKKDITVLHCNTAYPAELQDVNLRAMKTIEATFDIAVGFSDHTLGIQASLAAVSMGATVIEKHITLDRAMQGPDHMASMEPNDFKQMVTMIREIEVLLGVEEKRPSDIEIENLKLVRRSIVASKSISKGEKFSEDNLIAKRPATGISPMLWDEVIGTNAKRDFRKDELIEL